MAFIQLTKGFITEVDDRLLDDLNSYMWYASGLDHRPARRLRKEGRKLIYIYHQILDIMPWELAMNGRCVDHIDGDPLNNKLDNLRIVTFVGNAQNTNRHKFREGIGYDSYHDRFKVYIDRPNLPRVNVGTYKTREEADTVLVKARAEYSSCG